LLRLILLDMAAIAGGSLLLATSAQATDAFRPYLAVRVGGVFTEEAGVHDNSDFGAASRSQGSAEAKLESKAGFAIGGAAGVEAGYGRLDLEVMWRQSNIDDHLRPAGARDPNGLLTSYLYGNAGTFSVVTFLLNGYLALPRQGPVSPYLTAGVGGALASLDQYDQTGKHVRRDLQPAFQAGAGCTIPMTPNTSADLSYRYLGAADFMIYSNSIPYRSHSLLLGMNYLF